MYQGQYQYRSRRRTNVIFYKTKEIMGKVRNFFSKEGYHLIPENKMEKKLSVNQYRVVGKRLIKTKASADPRRRSKPETKRGYIKQ